MSVEVVTFGCRLNIHESEVIRRHAGAAGINDAIIVNTCAVTAEAVRQARQSIRRLKRERPDAAIVVTGCAAQTEPQALVRPAPRSQVRMAMWSRSTICASVILARSGKIG